MFSFHYFLWAQDHPFFTILALNLARCVCVFVSFSTLLQIVVCRPPTLDSPGGLLEKSDFRLCSDLSGGIHSLKPEKLCLVYSGDLYFLTTILKVISAMTILVFVFYLLPWLCDLHFLKIPFLWLSSTNCSGQQGCIGPTPSAPKENKELVWPGNTFVRAPGQGCV